MRGDHRAQGAPGQGRPVEDAWPAVDATWCCDQGGADDALSQGRSGCSATACVTVRCADVAAAAETPVIAYRWYLCVDCGEVITMSHLGTFHVWRHESRDILQRFEDLSQISIEGKCQN